MRGSIVTGMAATLSFGLSLRVASLIILFLTLLCTIPVAYLATIGPKTGMRQMIQARFSFGYYLVCVPVRSSSIECTAELDVS